VPVPLLSRSFVLQQRVRSFPGMSEYPPLDGIKGLGKSTSLSHQLMLSFC
jgi:hypothetical protein